MFNNFFLRKLIFLIGLTITLNFALTTAAQGSNSEGGINGRQSPFTPKTGQTAAFILLTTNNVAQLSQVEAVIAANGGHVTHTFPHQALIAAIPVSLNQILTTLPGVVLVATTPIELADIDFYGPAARRYAEVWNNLVTPAPALNLTAAENPADPQPGAFVAPDLPALDVASLSPAVTPGYYQTSEYMAGSVAVGIVLVESDGRVDPSTENWTNDEKQLVFSKIVAALNWWATLEPRAHLSFVYDDHFSTPLPTGVEPITRPMADQQYWINDAMSALGYTAPAYFTRVRDYNNAIRAAYQTDWAFTIFVVDSSADSDHRFSDGYFAYAYLGGPFLVMTYGNNGYGPANLNAVAAHEIGHIFLASDQYYSAHQPCDRASGYLNVPNQNSEYGGCASNVTSIMRGQIYPYSAHAVDPYAAGQVGWRDSDNDNILDPLDTNLPLTIDTLTQTDNTIAVSGAAQIIPYPSPSRVSVTINRLIGVQYRFNGGPWQPAADDDDAFDSTAENYHITATLTPGLYTLEVAALDSAGNVSAAYATQTITILDPVDGGLTTHLNQPNQPLTPDTPITLTGVAYHLTGGIITGVQYRLGAGPVQSAMPQDGAFDSSYEAFTLTLTGLDSGDYTVEAFATDGNGQVETDYANLNIEISATETHPIFLPLVMR